MEGVGHVCVHAQEREKDERDGKSAWCTGLLLLSLFIFDADLQVYLGKACIPKSLGVFVAFEFHLDQLAFVKRSPCMLTSCASLDLLLPTDDVHTCLGVFVGV